MQVSNKVVSSASTFVAIKIWQYPVMLNDGKTEFVIFGSKHNLSKAIYSSFNTAVKNLGPYFYPKMKIDMQVTKTARSAWIHIQNIGKI